VLVQDLSFAVQNVESDDVISFCVKKKRIGGFGQATIGFCSATARRLSGLAMLHRHADGMLNEFLKVTDWIYDSIDGDRDAYLFYRQLLNDHDHERHIGKLPSSGPPMLVETGSVRDDPLPVLWKTDLPIEPFRASAEQKEDQLMKT
jgi:hypothetical protein